MDFNTMYNVHIKFIEYLLAKSMFSLQDTKNVSLCGSEIENEIRQFFKNMLPARFRVTHGYIISSTSLEEEPSLSPQIDLIIVDELVMNKIFTLDKENGMEVVPVEAVVGVFEIKRTLTKQIYNEAVSHLEKIIASVSIRKDDETHYFPGGILSNNTNEFNIQTNIHSNPFIGIISLDHKIAHMRKISEMKADIIDAIISFSGMAILNWDDGKNCFKWYNIKVKGQLVPSKIMDKEEIKQSGIISRSFGYLLGYLTSCSGRIINVNNYFFHKSTWLKE